MTRWYRFARGVCRLVLRLHGSIEVIGEENIPRSGPAIVTPNHLSFLDPPAIGAAMHREGRFLARHTLWRNRLFGRIITATGAMPINRDKPDRASVRAVLAALDAGYPVVIFPEGTRSRDGRLLRGEHGIAMFVQKSGAPVIPAAIMGTGTILPPDARGTHRADVRVIFGPALHFTPDSSREEIVTGIMRAIAGLLTAHGVPTTAREDDPVDASQ